MIPYSVMAVSVMPKETVELEALLLDGHERLTATASAGSIEPRGANAWAFTAPGKPGTSTIEICDHANEETMTLRVFTLQPYLGEDVLRGYRIGKYERVPLRGDPAYAMPMGLIEVTESNEDAWVSPRFQLRQFLCKQKSGYPKFLLVRTRLLIKLEMVIDELRDQGHDVGGLHVMSGYRTPHYNRSIGNKTRYSRHAYGDAADVFIDEDADGYMDDLNNDGRRDLTDVREVSAVVEAMTDNAWYAPLRGGMGLYRPASHRGPFVHLDTRGRPARW